MAARRGFGRRPMARKIPNYEWAVLASPVLVAVPAASKVLLGSFINTSGNDLVIERVRGEFTVNSDQTAASEEVMGALGFMIVSEDAFAVGITAISSPVSDPTNSWFVWHPFTLFSETSTGQQVNNPAGRPIVVDSKSKRVFEGNTRVVVVAENFATVGGLEMIFVLRVLAKLRA